MNEPQPLGAVIWKRVRKRWRAWLRAVHRDVGYLLVGLTVIYAVSGIAINHIDDWNANFKQAERTITFEGELPGDDAAATKFVLDKLGVDEKPSDVFRAGPEMEITIGPNHSIRVVDQTIFEDHQEPRFFLRIANWLHYNRGKKAWQAGAKYELRLDRASRLAGPDGRYANPERLPLPVPAQGMAAYRSADAGLLARDDFFGRPRGASPSQGAVEPL